MTFCGVGWELGRGREEGMEVEERCIYDGVFMKFGGYSEAEADS